MLGCILFTVLQYWNFKIKELRKEIGRYNQINCRCLQDLETNDDNENTYEKIEAIIKKEKRLEYVFRCLVEKPSLRGTSISNVITISI
ncbi:hypothetical protein V1477_008295 [Vespula maculifrons]|uniref:Uncharacterized protein n=1 Tax=Vespula maculifrons TaxID=7453 RepID=A0ABD2CCL9_VESMC